MSSGAARTLAWLAIVPAALVMQLLPTAGAAHAAFAFMQNQPETRAAVAAGAPAAESDIIDPWRDVSPTQSTPEGLLDPWPAPEGGTFAPPPPPPPRPDTMLPEGPVTPEAMPPEGPASAAAPLPALVTREELNNPWRSGEDSDWPTAGLASAMVNPWAPAPALPHDMRLREIVDPWSTL
jgi:hypothetical protein